MKDPREKKLPQWAQQLLYDERLKVALRFPDQPSPEPDFVASQDSGAWIEGKGAPDEGQVVFYVSGEFIRLAWVFGRYLFPKSKASGLGRRPAGPFFIHEDDARLALRWKKARRAAHDLLQAETAIAIRD